MVISRLLHKTLSQDPNSPPFVDVLRSQLVSLRITILQRIDRKLGSVNSTAEDIIDCMSAFCLATSTSSLDVIRHFQDVIEKQMAQSDTSSGNIPKALNLYIKTLQSTKILFSRRLSDALSKLQAQPLLTDADIRNLDALDINIFERWISGDVKNFTPWIKLDESSKTFAEQTIKNWSKRAFERWIHGSEKSLRDRNDFADLLSLRKKTLDIWLLAAPETVTHSFLSTLDGIRNVFNKQLTSILASQAVELSAVGREVKSTIEQWSSQDRIKSQFLWDSSLTNMDYSNGADVFKQAVVDTLLGQDEKTSRVLDTYRSWRATVESSSSLIEDLRHTSWEDNLVYDDDDDEDLTNPVALLNEDDPRLLLQEQSSAVETAFGDLQDSFRAATELFGSSDRSRKAAFLLRLIRDLRRESPTTILRVDKSDFADEVVPGLQEVLSTETVTLVSPEKFLGSPKGAIGQLPGRTLWEGDPELPIQPLSSTFQFLRRLVEVMEEIGADLWSPFSVQVLKREINVIVSKCLTARLNHLKKSAAVQDDAEDADLKENLETAEPDQGNDSVKTDNVGDWKIQLLLDAFYLHDILSSNADNTDPLSSFIEKLQGEIETGAGIIGTLQESAHEYWRRTELLFGLLAR